MGKNKKRRRKTVERATRQLAEFAIEALAAVVGNVLANRARPQDGGNDDKVKFTGDTRPGT
jgi:hypothetical protein